MCACIYALRHVCVCVGICRGENRYNSMNPICVNDFLALKISVTEGKKPSI